MFPDIQGRQMPNFRNLKMTQGPNRLHRYFIAAWGIKSYLCISIKHTSPGEGHMCLILKRINRMVCLEDRKTIPMAGRGRKWRKERAREKDSARKMEQIQKLCELEEVRETEHTLKKVDRLPNWEPVSEMTAELVTVLRSREWEITHKPEDIDLAHIKTAFGTAMERMRRNGTGRGQGEWLY